MAVNRMDRLNQQFKREIGSMILLGEIGDSRLGFVSVTYVDISKDLSYAHVGFSVLADDPGCVNSVQHVLDVARSRVRRLLAERLEIRHIPEIKFVYDNSIAEAVRMTNKLDTLKQERAPGETDEQ